MAANTATPTRAEALRRYVELNALGDFLVSLVRELEAVEERQVLDGSLRDGEPMFAGIDPCILEVDDGRLLPGLYASMELLWPPDDEESEYEKRDGSVDGCIAEMESSALVARLFALLATDEGRARVLALSTFYGMATRRYAGWAQEHLNGGDDA